MASTAILAVSQIIIANMLGDERLGEYAVVLIPYGIVILVQDLGISAGLTSSIARHQHQGIDEKQTLTSGLFFNLLVSVIVTTAVFIGSPLLAANFLHRPELEVHLRVASLAILGYALFHTTNSIFNGYGKMKLNSLNTIVMSVSRALISPILVFVGLGTMGAVAGHSLSYLLAGCVGILQVLLLVRSKDLKVDFSSMVKELRYLIRYGLPIYISILLNGGLNQFYNSLLAVYVMTALIGNYTAAGNFTILVYFITGPISVAIFPLFSKLRRGDENLGKSFQSAIKYSSVLALPIAGALIALSDQVIGVLYGGKFPMASTYLRLLMLSNYSIGLGTVVTGNLLNGQGETRINLWCALLTLLTGGSLALILVPSLGVIGMLLAMIVAQIPAISYALFWVKKNLDISLDWKAAVKIFSSVTLSTAMTYLFQLTQTNIWIQLLVGGAIYVASYAISIRAFEALNRVDYEMFKAIVGDRGPLSRIINRLIDFMISNTYH